MVYPAGSDDSTLRSHNRHLELAERIHPESDGPDFYGVKQGITFLIESLPHIDIINDIVIDYMHNCCLGRVTDNWQLCMKLMALLT